MSFTQGQLQSFFGENVDVSTLPAAIVGSNISYSSMLTTFCIILAIVFIITIFKKIVCKIQKMQKKQIILSSLTGLASYEDKIKEEKENKQIKHNIYNKYYFNVYVNKPYHKSNKQNNYKKSDYKHYENNNYIDAEIVL